MPASPLVKICGLSTGETLEAALGAGADRVGFVFFPRSPRHIDLATARRLAAQARGRAEIVALSVDAEDEALAAVVEATQPDLLQLHGRESPERIGAVRARFGRPVVKALGVSTRADLAGLAALAAAADHILFDAKPPRDAVLPGGNGNAFDWTLLGGLDLSVPFMLSGGLTAENVGTALDITQAPGVDVSSGVESAPGRKDPAKIEAFVRAARRAASA